LRPVCRGRARLPDFDQLDVERQRLAGQGVVQVETDRVVAHGGDPRHAALARRHLHLDLLADRRGRAFRELIGGYIDHQLGLRLAIGLGRVEADLAGLALGQPLDRAVEAGDDLAGADLELEGSRPRELSKTSPLSSLPV
jgi:hypothetical protein